jgi:hypothetical protein
MQSGKIFVCYRREDSAGHAGRLYDRLNQRFPGRVFMDVASIGVGTRWARVIGETLASCQVAIIMIGREWLAAAKEGGRRIDQANDPIRAEVTSALRSNLTIVPLLVSGAAMPKREELPADLVGLTEWQALRVDDDDFDHDAARLLRALERQLGEPPASPVSGGVPDAGEIRRLPKTEAPGAQQPWQPPTPPGQGTMRRSGFLGIALGPFRMWITVGVAAMAVLVVQLAIRPQPATDSTSPRAAPPAISPSPGSTAPAVRPGDSAAAPVEPAPPAVAKPPAPSADSKLPDTAAPSLAGQYDIVSYREHGIALPIAGTMKLVELQPGSYQFSTFVTNTALGVSFTYVGTFQGGGNSYALTTAQTNDPNALIGVPIATRVGFDGTTLATENGYGQAAVWRRR